MGTFKSYKEESRKNYGRTVAEGGGLNAESLKIGCLQRIADATEAMAKNHAELIAERDEYKARLDRSLAREERLLRQRAALRGVITRMKKRAADWFREQAEQVKQ